MRIAAVAALETLLVIAVAWLNPFHIDEWAYARNQSVWQRVMADDYGCQADRRQATEPTGQNPWCGLFHHRVEPPPIRIVYFDETGDGATTVSKAKDSPSHTSLPAKQLSLSRQADALQDLTDARVSAGPAPRPSAIFIDFLFDDAAPDLKDYGEVLPVTAKENNTLAACTAAGARAAHDPLQCYLARVAEITQYGRWAADPYCQTSVLNKLACIVRSGGIPVIFATSQSINPAKDEPPQTAAVLALGQVALTAPAHLEGPGYELVPEIKPGQPINPETRFNEDYRMPAVPLLYAAQCLATTVPHACKMLATDGSPDCTSRLRSGLETPGATASTCDLRWNNRFAAPLAVRWGVGNLRPDPEDNPDTRSDFELMMARLHGAAVANCRSAEPGLISRVGRLLREAVPIWQPHDPPPLCRYVPAVPYRDFDGALTDSDKRLILDHQVVLLGGQYQTSGDWVPAIVENAPGVHYHAMALANLMALNGKYPHVELPVTSGSAFSFDAWPSFIATWVIAVLGGLGVMGLNEPGLDPARTSGGAPPPQATRWERLLWRGRARWVARALIVVGPPVALALAFALVMEPIVNLNLTVILAILATTSVKLLFHMLRPLLEEGRRFFRWFDISDGRLFGPDIDPPIVRRPPEDDGAASAKEET